MDNKIQDLIKISRLFGNNPDYIIAGGGNTSFKNKKKIWVKASGTSMAVIDEDGFVCLDRKKLQILSTKKYSENAVDRENEVKHDLISAVLNPKDKRPSVETSMHEIIQFPFVVHTHPSLVNGLLCAKNSKTMVDRLFGDDALYIEYIDPGYLLFKKVYSALKEYRVRKQDEPSIIFLENHGVFVGAETIKQIDEIYSHIRLKISECISDIPANEKKRAYVDLNDSVRNIAKNPFTNSLKSTILANSMTNYYVKNKQTFNNVSVPFIPDHIVYCNSNYLFVEDEKKLIREIREFAQSFGYYPKVVAIKGKGIIAIEENEKSAQIVADVFNDMMKVSYVAENFGGGRSMTKKQIDFINNWEIENYRRQISKND